MRLKLRKFNNHLKVLWFDKDMIGYKEWNISFKSGIKSCGWRPF